MNTSGPAIFAALVRGLRWLDATTGWSQAGKSHPQPQGDILQECIDAGGTLSVVEDGSRLETMRFVQAKRAGLVQVFHDRYSEEDTIMLTPRGRDFFGLPAQNGWGWPKKLKDSAKRS